MGLPYLIIFQKRGSENLKYPQNISEYTSTVYGNCREQVENRAWPAQTGRHYKAGNSVNLTGGFLFLEDIFATPERQQI
jgi:hypothetical protein